MVGLHIDNGLNITVDNIGINISEPKGVSHPLSTNPKLRFITISKSLDSKKYTEADFNKLNIKIKDILGQNLNEYKFILSFESQESEAVDDVIEFYKKVIDYSECLIVSINIEKYESKVHCFLNNPDWILNDIDNSYFFEFWKYIKRMDLGTIKKKFMFLNNHYSEIRFDILKVLYKKGYHRDGNISFNYINFDQNGLDENKMLKDMNHFGIEYPKFYDAIPTLSQVTEDERNGKNLVGINHVATLSSFNYRIYLESFFEIITETHPHLVMKGVHISEKIHKPLRTALPFVYYGNPKLKNILESIGLTFNSPIYFFGMGIEFFNHLNYILEKDIKWYHDIQKTYIDEYFNNMDKWIEFVKKNNKEILKFMFI
jgi:hypothetical protein